jgi:hypothetical protein
MTGRKKRTAIHEAGHAVVAAYLRVAMVSVTIQPDFEAEEWGHARHASSAAMEDLCWTAAGQCKLAMVLLAARAAGGITLSGCASRGVGLPRR